MGAKPNDPAHISPLDNDPMQTGYPPFGSRPDSRPPTPAYTGVAPPSPSRRIPPPAHLNGYASAEAEQARRNSDIDEILETMFGRGSAEARAFYDASRTAPITKSSLSELDIGSIINNSKLRHDVNFDCELHFRPNIDGERGRRKREIQALYWRSLSVELHIIFHVLGMDLDDSSKATLVDQCSGRLGQMFETIKEIMKNLIPERDQDDVDDQLDIPILMQKISRGVCDFVSIAAWIAQLLKRHCAPMRDELVDRMVEKIGGQTPDSITNGLVDLFNVLEAMKLDVANHQIRHLRALLIDDTVNFETKYHISRIKKRRYDCLSARRWYKSLRASEDFVRVPITKSWPNKDVEAFVRGFLRLLMPTTERLPDTFALDMDRIRMLKADIDDSIRESICCDVLREMVGQSDSTLSSKDETTFRRRLQIISADEKGAIWSPRTVGDVVCEMVRFTLQLSGRSEEIDGELEDAATHMLESRLRALVLARTTDYGWYDQPERSMIENYGNELFEQLSWRVFRTVENYLSSSPYDVFLALVPPIAPPPTYTMPSPVRPIDRRQDLVRRIAHIGILHWRTWEHLVYNNEDMDQDTEEEGTVYSSRSTTPGPPQELRQLSPSHMAPPLAATFAETEKTGENVTTKASAG